jgi:hypothetical protein
MSSTAMATSVAVSSSLKATNIIIPEVDWYKVSREFSSPYGPKEREKGGMQ